MFDWIRAPLTCPYRGGRVEADALDLQTHMARHPSQNVFGVGDEIDLDPNLESAGYFRVGTHAPDPDDLTVLEEWSCPCCGMWRWARIRVIDGRIARVEAVPLTEATLAESDFISEAAEMMIPTEEPELMARFRALSPADRRRELVRLQDRIERLRDAPIT